MDWKTRWNNFLADLRITDWIIAIFTAVLSVVAFLQYREMRSGGIDTHALADAAKKQATAAQKSADAAQKFAESAASINTGIQSAVAQLGNQVSKMDTSIGQAKRLASATETANQNVIEADRPWLGGYINPVNFAVGEKPSIELLRRFVPDSWTIVLHPDTIHSYSAWKVFGKQLAIENMDRRKSTGRTVEELDVIFEKLPDATLCFDIGHARQCDTTMTEAYRILRKCSNRLCQLHVSEVNTASRHDPLSFAAILAFAEVAELIPQWVPVILESRVTPDQLTAEIGKAQKALPVTDLQAVPA